MNPTEIKDILYKWHFYKAAADNLGDNSALPQKINLIERMVDELDDTSRLIIKKRFFEAYGADDVAIQMSMSRQAVHKRIAKFVKTMAYILS